MLEIGICLIFIMILIMLYAVFGKMAARIFKIRPQNGICVLLGVFVYHGLFQVVALPLILLKQSLSLLSGIWAVFVVLVLLAYFFGVRMLPELGWELPYKRKRPSVISIVMIILVLLQAYYMITSEYLGWDTSFYVGTIGTSVNQNSMYLVNGENGSAYSRIPFRYALSSFYMHSAVWCRMLRITAVHYAKIVQGGILAILSNLVVYEIGKFLFSGKRYHGIIKKENIGDCAAGMVTAVVILNVFWNTIYSTSDFLLSRALEAKSYCANLVLPCVFLFAIMLWRDSEDRTAKICLAAAAWSSVAISMSSLVIVPAMVAIMFLPIGIKKSPFRWMKCYLICILPNLCYLVLYLLDKMKIIGIEV